MKKIFCGLLVFFALFGTVQAKNDRSMWLTDVQQALKTASEQNKQIMVLVTGSKWCRPCQNLERNVWSSKEFAAFAQKNLVLLKADVPYRSSGFGPRVYQKVLDLVKHSGSVPCVYLLDSRGKILEKVEGYDNSRTAGYLKRFKKLEGNR